MSTFRGWLATHVGGNFRIALQTLERDQLSEGDVVIRVAYSSLNYKDGLAVTGKPGVIRKWPMVPGVDVAGTVEESGSPEFKPGDKVVVTSSGASETHWGGYGELTRLRSEWIVPLPSGLTLQQAAAIGTAGVTAMYCLIEMEKHGLKPGGREVVVTGAAGGVGSVAVALLSHLGYQVVASSGRAELTDYLTHLGAARIIDRSVLSGPGKPLDTEVWAGAIDSVGGDTLTGLLRGMETHGTVTLCGLAGGNTFTSTVFPFILRGVRLIGIDAVRLTNPERREIWRRLAVELPLPLLDELTTVEPLEKVPELGAQILKGAIRGRTVIQVGTE